MEKKLNITIEEKKAIANFFSSKLSKEDSKILNNWLERSNRNKLFFDELSDIWTSANYIQIKKQIDSDQAWQSIQQYISKKQKIQLYKCHKYLKIAAILILVFFLGGTSHYFIKKGIKNSHLIVEHTAPLGSHSFIKMPDGSKIWLNAGTTLSYDNTFGIAHREIKLSGEAFFEIAKNPKKPFRVKTNTMNIQVLGTKFQVTAYPEDDQTSTYLEEGKIQLIIEKTNNNYTLNPGEEYCYEKQNKKLIITKNKRPQVATWRYNQFTFYNQSLKNIVQNIERSFNVNIEIENDAKKNIKLTAEFKDESMYQMLNYLAQLTNSKIIKNNKNYILK